MHIYILFYTLLIILSYISIRPTKNSLIYYFAAALIILVASCRSNGYDWISYEDIYKSLLLGHKTEGGTFIEYGFEVLCMISPTYRILIFLTALISLYFTFKAVYHFSKLYYPVLGLLIFSTTFLLPTFMGQIRQGLAIGFVTCAVWQNYIGNKRNAFLWIVFASFLHLSAILAAIIVVIPKKDFSLRTYILIIIASILFYGISLKLMSQLLTFSQFGFVQKLLIYATSEKEELGISSTILIRIAILLTTVILNRNKDKAISYLSKIYLCGIIIYLLFGFLPQLGGRGALYFSIYEMVLIPNLVYDFRKRHALFLLIFSVIICLTIFRIVNFFSNSFNYSSYIPYNLY